MTHHLTFARGEGDDLVVKIETRLAPVGTITRTAVNLWKGQLRLDDRNIKLVHDNPQDIVDLFESWGLQDLPTPTRVREIQSRIMDELWRRRQEADDQQQAFHRMKLNALRARLAAASQP